MDLTPAILKACVSRDVSALFRLLRDGGMPQWQIADLVNMKQSEVSEIIKGRQVQSYDVLVRVCNGLDIPRGHMGLAYTGDEPEPEEVSEEVKRRALFGVASVALFGSPVLGELLDLPAPSEPTPLPSRISKADVVAMRSLTERLRRLARTYGGCADMVTGVAQQSLKLLTVSAAETVKDDMTVAIGQLHTLAGWCCVDSGLGDAAQTHFAKAMELGDLTSALRHAGIHMCDGGHYNDGLKAFQLALIRDNNPWLHLETAKPYAELGDTRATLSAVALARQSPQDDPFDSASMDYISGRAYERLGRFDQAETLLASSVGQWSQLPNAKRDGVEAAIALAALHVRTGASDGPSLVIQAIQGVSPLQSIRARRKLTPLVQALELRGGSTYTDLARHVRKVQQRV